jgi:predicted transcriptional regulator of viral defense system
MSDVSHRKHGALFDRAFDQYGLVTAGDAEELGLDEQDLIALESQGTLERAAGGLYRYCDRLMDAALWPGGIRGVLTHSTALELYGLCEGNSAGIHLTVPRLYRIRREAPAAYVIHYRDLPQKDLATVDGLPTITPWRAIMDLIEEQMEPELESQVIENARRKSLVNDSELREFDRVKNSSAD